ncbi:hypothetical protein [Glycomyces sp. NRRL B-16210]|uniref:arsenate reductase/protein-tyrosine-phosphatase family protein n=1 Tax=Glycomyces sp. NRRL B-16210 TaxID=1463821 RepID=UPI00068EA516|nr:hypothetical protein [Glycomyces sp. NRRL B-16210]
MCSANLCRSVLAERLSRLWIEHLPECPSDRFAVSSAGTEAVPGLGMPPRVARYLLRRGADAGAFASRRLTPALVEQADLVLAATRLERDRVIAASPGALRRTFTLNEFARLPPRTGPGAAATEVRSRARSIMAEAMARRGQVAGLDGEDDVADPGNGRRSIERCAAEVDSAVTAVLRLLTVERAFAGER